MVWKASKDCALIIVDVQNDFMPGGNLGVPGGDQIVPLINFLRDQFEHVILTQDYHPAGHSSFASSHDGFVAFTEVQMEYGPQMLWPDHCVQGTKGAAFHQGLVIRPSDLILQKGTNIKIDSYSAFFENDHKLSPVLRTGKNLSQTLKDNFIQTIVVAGLAGDYCVAYTAIDGLHEGFKVVVVEDAMKSIDASGQILQNQKIRDAGGKVIRMADLQSALS